MFIKFNYYKKYKMDYNNGKLSENFNDNDDNMNWFKDKCGNECYSYNRYG